jgi:hypothetical protein
MKDNRAQILKALQRGDVGTLNKDQVKLLDIYNLADNIITLHGINKESVQVFMATVNEKYGGSMSRSMAYLRMQEAQTVLGSACVFNKQYWKGYLVDRILKLTARIEREIYADEAVQELKENEAPQAQSPTPKPLPVEPKLAKELLKAYEQIAQLMQLDKEDAPINPDGDVDTVVITDKPSMVGFSDYVELTEELEQKLLELGARKNKDNEWQ